MFLGGLTKSQISNWFKKATESNVIEVYPKLIAQLQLDLKRYKKTRRISRKQNIL